MCRWCQQPLPTFTLHPSGDGLAARRCRVPSPHTMSFAFPSTAGASAHAASVETAASKPTKTIIVEIGENEKGPGVVMESGVVTIVLQGNAGARAGIVTGMRLVSVAGQAVASGGDNAKVLLRAQCRPKARFEVEVEEADEEVLQATPATTTTTTATTTSTAPWRPASGAAGLHVSSGFGFSSIRTQPAPAAAATKAEPAWAAPQPPSMPVTAAPVASAVLADAVPSLKEMIVRESDDDQPQNKDAFQTLGQNVAGGTPAPAAAAAADSSDIASLSPSSLAGSSCDSDSDTDGDEQSLRAYLFDCETTRRRAEASASARARLIHDNAACLRQIRVSLEANTPYTRPAAPLRVRRRRVVAAAAPHGTGEAAAVAAAAALAAQAAQASPAVCLADLRSLSSDADSLRDAAAAATAAAERGFAGALESAEEAAAAVAEDVDAAVADVFETPLEGVEAAPLSEAEEVLCGVAERTGDEGLARLGRCRHGADADGDGGLRREGLVEELQAAAGDAGASVEAGERAGRQLRKALRQQDAVARLLAEEKRLRAIHGLAEAMCVPEVGKTPVLFKTVFGDTGLAKLEVNSLS